MYNYIRYNFHKTICFMLCSVHNYFDHYACIIPTYVFGMKIVLRRVTGLYVFHPQGVS